MVNGESLLQRIRSEFYECACQYGERDSETLIQSSDIARHWQCRIESGRNSLGQCALEASDKQVIALRAAQFIGDASLYGREGIGISEWIHHMMFRHFGFIKKHAALPAKQVLLRNVSRLEDWQKLFFRADTQGTGTFSLDEATFMYKNKLWHFRPGGSKPLSDEELDLGDSVDLARGIIREMSLNDAEYVTYPEFMCYCLGKRKHEVLLYLYDISSSAIVNAVGGELQQIWHTAVVVFGKEYYFGKDAMFAQPGGTSFGKPTKAMRLGYTCLSDVDLCQHVEDILKPRFHRDTYDCVTNNCVHFADALSMYLVDQHLPNDVLMQSDLLLQSSVVRVARPMVNWLLLNEVVARKPIGHEQESTFDGSAGASENVSPGVVVYVHPGIDNEDSHIVARIKDVKQVATCFGVNNKAPLCRPAKSALSCCSNSIAADVRGLGSLVHVQYLDVGPVHPQGASATRTWPRFASELKAWRDVLLCHDFSMQIGYQSAMHALGEPCELRRWAAGWSSSGFTCTMPTVTRSMTPMTPHVLCVSPSLSDIASKPQESNHELPANDRLSVWV
eukprot:TRINITY_DN28896_c0_g1_i1.p1 TRINITY_DN28896_c0_g1~~TRINITY_DN28896_c0_g1_i1.p1  ORF type:complete len:561 (-),score=26.52 TRINITY_DN28896_c0_g1_i1:323-2005(-)